MRLIFPIYYDYAGTSSQQVSAGPARLAISAPVAALLAGAVLLGGGSQSIAIAAPTAQRSAGAVTIAAGANTIALTAPTATLAPGARALSAGATTIAITAPPATLTPGARSLPAGTTTLAITAPTAAIRTGKVLSASTSAIAITAPTASLSAGAAQVPAGATTIAITAPSASAAAGVRTLTAAANTIAIKAPPAGISQASTLAAGVQTIALAAPAPTVVSGAVTRAAGIQTVAISAPPAVRLALKTLAAGTNLVVITAPTATRIATAALPAGTQTIAVTAPVATRTVTAVTRAAGANVVTITAPTAIRLSETRLNAGAQTVAVSAPTATLVPGSVAIDSASGGTQPSTVALIAPAPRVIGGAELPANIIVATVTSRAPVRATVATGPARTVVDGVLRTVMSRGVTRTLVVATTVDAYQAAILADGPTAYWRLNELTGLIAKDIGGGGHDGSLFATGITLGQPGALADGTTSMLFDGADTTRITVIFNPVGGSVSSAVTLEAWGNPATLAQPTQSTLIATAFQSHNWVSVLPTGALSVSLQIGGSQQQLTSAPNAVVAGAWHHVVVTYDGATIIAYVNGVQVGTLAGLSGAVDLVGTLDRFVIGRYSQVAGSGFNGRIDEVALYAAALPGARVAAHYALRTASAPLAAGILRTVEFSG
jgi:hypothetical protein